MEEEQPNLQLLLPQPPREFIRYDVPTVLPRFACLTQGKEN